MKVFLVEDSPPVLERLTEMLGAIPNTQVIGHATAVDAAIRDILSIRPDLVVLDLHLADGSGFEVLSAVHEREPGIDVYMLSNFASEPYRRQAERLGAAGFFDKSSEIECVRAVVASHAQLNLKENRRAGRRLA
jgi:DNA-binding NarL/FixJ family response regulator